MNLREWLFRNNVKHIEFSRRIGVSNTWFSKILYGKTRPSVALSQRIEDETKGEVAKEEILFLKDETLKDNSYPMNVMKIKD